MARMNTSPSTISQLFVTTPTMIGAGIMLGMAAVRLLAWALKLRAYNKHEDRKLKATPEQLAALQAPPDIPENITKIMMVVFLLGGLTVLIGVLWRGGQIYWLRLDQERSEAELLEHGPDAGVVVDAAARPEAQELLAQSCTTDKECGSGCACKDKQCRCAAMDRKAPAGGKGKKSGTGGGSGSGAKEGPGPTSSVASSMAGRRMAGEATFAGSL